MACELARHGVRCRIIDRLPQPRPYCRAIGVMSRTLEVWEDMGVVREMIDAGLWIDGFRSIIHPNSGSWSRIAWPWEAISSTFACRVRPPVSVVAGRVGGL
jgi:2-polyprenyl-6-methoxyphenol hydroxylase-like FAD-dependent oxidoreductase